MLNMRVISMNKIKISVIIPTFNRNNLLKKSLKSLSEQSLNRNEYEVIICDDGSYESAVTIVKEFENKLNIKYCYHSNKGYRVALARNEGIYLAKGEICAFIDYGMIVIPEFLENHLKLHKKIIIIYCTSNLESKILGAVHKYNFYIVFYKFAIQNSFCFFILHQS